MVVGEFVVTQDSDGRTVIERKLGNGTATAELPADKYVHYKIHFESPAVLLRTDSGFKDTSHNDVRYRWSLANLAAQKPSMVNKVENGCPGCRRRPGRVPGHSLDCLAGIRRAKESHQERGFGVGVRRGWW